MLSGELHEPEDPDQDDRVEDDRDERGGASPMIGATINPSTTQALMARTSTETRVRSRPTIVMKPAAPTRAATMKTPSFQWELKPKIAPINTPPSRAAAGRTR